MLKQALRYILFILFLQTFATMHSFAQTVQGVIFQKGTSTRIQGAVIINLRNHSRISSDGLGAFRLLAATGDTLEVRAIGFLPQKQVVKNYSTMLVYLQLSNQLTEVIIHGKTLKQDLKEVEDQFRSKGIYYKGKPPLVLLLPFGGSPLTFFHELLSKDGKRARRFHKYAEKELEYYEIASRFNDRVIKSTVPIKDAELTEFKTQYLPTVEQLKAWNDFDVMNYIKKSYEQFRKEKPNN